MLFSTLPQQQLFLISHLAQCPIETSLFKERKEMECSVWGVHINSFKMGWNPIREKALTLMILILFGRSFGTWKSLTKLNILHWERAMSYLVSPTGNYKMCKQICVAFLAKLQQKTSSMQLFLCLEVQQWWSHYLPFTQNRSQVGSLLELAL